MSRLDDPSTGAVPPADATDGGDEPPEVVDEPTGAIREPAEPSDELADESAEETAGVSDGAPPTGVVAAAEVGGPTAGGPAPPRKTRRQLRREWRQADRARRYAARKSVRFPIFTRSILLWMLMFALMGIASGVTAAFFWSHFNTDINELREQVRDFDQRSQDAQSQIDAVRNQALTDIDERLKPIAGYLAETRTIQLSQVFAPYVWFVSTLDEEGRASVGSSFPISSGDTSTLLVTSFNTVRAASVSPAPAITLRKGDDELEAKLVNFDANRDLALLEVQRGGMPVLEWAPDAQQAEALGLRVFPVSGLGGTGASLTSGIVIDQSAAGFLHTAPIGTFMQGGPIVTADGKVIGIASLTYRPLGFDPGELHFSVQVNAICYELLQCGGGTRPG